MRQIRKPVSFLFAALLVNPYFALAKDKDRRSIDLEPNAEWNLRELDDRCRISQSFGRGENETTLWIDKGGPGRGINLTIIGKPLHKTSGSTLELTFAPEPEQEHTYVRATSSKGRPVVMLFGIQPVAEDLQMEKSPDEAESNEPEEVNLDQAAISSGLGLEAMANRLAHINSLNLSGAVRKPISLSFRSLGEMLSGLTTCVADLTIRLASKPSPQPRNAKVWRQVMERSFPVHSLLREEEGVLTVRLTVSRSGKPTFCEVTEFQGPAAFNATACLLLLQNAEFLPSKNSKGEPVASFFWTRLTYRLRG